MRRTDRWAALGAGLLLTTGLTACNSGGGSNVAEEPATALSEAVGALGDHDGLELTLSFDGDRDAVLEAAGDDLDAETADLLLSSSLVVRAVGQDESDAQAEFVLNLGDQQAFEMRVLPEQELFLRVDLDAVSSAVDDPEFESGLDEMVTMAGSFGLGEVASAVRAGDWIQLTGTEQLAELAGGATDASEEPSEEETEDVRERVVAAFQRFLDEDVDVTYVGAEDAGERVTATTTEGDLATLFDEIAGIAGDVSGVDPDALGADVSAEEGSDTPVEVDFWIDGGQLRQVGYDLSQIEGEGSPPDDTFVLVGIEEFGGSVEAPAESTEIDLFSIMGGFLGGMGAPGGADGDVGGAEGDGTTDGATDGGGEGAADPLAGECIPEDQIDMLTGGDETAREELDQAIEMGLIEIC